MGNAAPSDIVYTVLSKGSLAAAAACGLKLPREVQTLRMTEQQTDACAVDYLKGFADCLERKSSHHDGATGT